MPVVAVSLIFAVVCRADSFFCCKHLKAIFTFLSLIKWLGLHDFFSNLQLAFHWAVKLFSWLEQCAQINGIWKSLLSFTHLRACSSPSVCEHQALQCSAHNCTVLLCILLNCNFVLWRWVSYASEWTKKCLLMSWWLLMQGLQCPRL